MYMYMYTCVFPFAAAHHSRLFPVIPEPEFSATIISRGGLLVNLADKLVPHLHRASEFLLWAKTDEIANQ